MPFKVVWFYFHEFQGEENCHRKLCSYFGYPHPCILGKEEVWCYLKSVFFISEGSL